VQLVTVMLLQGCEVKFFRQMPSSSASTTAPLTVTLRQPLMSMPSLQLLQWLYTLMSLMVMFSQA